jgi:ABC-type antimicrobial peptide transport system permease subunit
MGVARRTREVGIRVALGATRNGIVRLLMREQLMAVVLGLAIGAVASIRAVQLVKQHVYENAVYDGRIWAIAIATIAIVAAVGVLVPARRASTVDPVRSLRVE